MFVAAGKGTNPCSMLAGCLPRGLSLTTFVAAPDRWQRMNRSSPSQDARETTGITVHPSMTEKALSGPKCARALLTLRSSRAGADCHERIDGPVAPRAEESDRLTSVETDRFRGVQLEINCGLYWYYRTD